LSATSTDVGGKSLSARLGGLLFFPVTAFGPGGQFDPDTYRLHLRRGLTKGITGVFPCCGTGEFFSVDLADYAAVVAVAVEECAGACPVVSGLGYGTALAKQFAHIAESAGADGLLVMPPYLVQAGQEGLRRHFEELSEATTLDLILYQRDNAIFAPETVATLARRPNIVGLKDGYGDLDHLQRVMTAVRTAGNGAEEEFVFVNGMPTAEMMALPFRSLGVEAYSSAVYAFAPEIANAFWTALHLGDGRSLRRLLDEFYVPFVRLRSQGSGYAVSLTKAAVRLRGTDVGGVRAPLAEPTPEHIDALARLIESGVDLAAKL
jgi:5-dehydro-4-deoxyglucarate dehydratase